MSSQSNDSIEILITRHILRETNKVEEEEIMRWVAENPENEAIYTEFSKAFKLSSSHLVGSPAVVPTEIDINNEWNAFKEKISETNEAKSVDLSSKPSSNSFFMKIAASILVIFLVGFGAYKFLQPTPDIILSATAQTLTDILPDNSTVTLNINSQISYNKEFNIDKRELHLKGEAFFEITPDKTRPFIIHANNTTVQVVGTSFSVRAPEGGLEVEVIVKSGVVAFSATESGKSVRLEAGSRGYFHAENQDISVSENQDVNFLAWKTGTIIFEEATLEEVVKTLSKVYHVEFEVPQSADCEATVTFSSQSIESVMKVLEATWNLTYSIIGNKIIISATGC